jgi:hypothetical protein
LTPDTASTGERLAFVATSEGGAVRGHYTLLAGQVEHEEATEKVRRGLSPTSRSR